MSEVVGAPVIDRDKAREVALSVLVELAEDTGCSTPSERRLAAESLLVFAGR